jgi:hypothetical protein
MNLNHTIVAMVGGAAKRVQCLSCNKQHNFRAPKGAEELKKKKAAKPRKAAGTPRVTNLQKEWQTSVAEQSATEFTPYSIQATFEEGQLVQHSKFGPGCVKEDLGSQKLSVLFEDGLKTLIHGRG